MLKRTQILVVAIFFAAISVSLAGAAGPANDRASTAVVEGEGAGAMAYLQDFQKELLKQLGVADLSKSTVRCTGCAELGGSNQVTRLTYEFPEGDTKAMQALTVTWHLLGGKMNFCDTSCAAPGSSTTPKPAPDCNSYYPPTCYSRPNCPGGPTPYCGRYVSGSCAYCT